MNTTLSGWDKVNGNFDLNIHLILQLTYSNFFSLCSLSLPFPVSFFSSSGKSEQERRKERKKEREKEREREWPPDLSTFPICSTFLIRLNLLTDFKTPKEKDREREKEREKEREGNREREREK